MADPSVPVASLEQRTKEFLAEWDAWVSSCDPERAMPAISPSVRLVRELADALAAQREALTRLHTELSYRDLRDSGGLPEAQIDPLVTTLRALANKWRQSATPDLGNGWLLRKFADELEAALSASPEGDHHG